MKKVNFLIYYFIFTIGILYSQQQLFQKYDEIIMGSKHKISMTPIHGGTFQMGSLKTEKNRKKDEGPVHKVTIDDFWMSTIEITWDIYELFLTRNTDHVQNTKKLVQVDIDGVSGATMPYVNYNKNGLPVINITQYGASQFCKWLTAKSGNYYRLPTEAEWEYACRGGTITAYSFGKDERKIDRYAWYKNNSEGKLQKGALKQPNNYGLYDMHGNAAEWVLDNYDSEAYIARKKGVNNPIKKNKAIYPRVVRGGSFKDSANQLRSASRGYSKRTWKQRDPQIPKSLWWHTDATHVGFRIVRPKISPSNEELSKYWVKPKKEY